MTDDARTGRRAVGAIEDTLRSDRITQTESGCFTDDGAAAYLAGAVDESVRDLMRAHLDDCEGCQKVVLYGARASGSLPTEDTAPFRKEATPHRIGRFTILDTLGVGGMGVVYSAFDNELDRKVALKLVRTELRDERPEATRAAMLREAKAMAKVDHPNVITVFEVGTHDDQIFVAMELVGGGDLRNWLKTAQRSWREALATCRQAGLGLAAAHRANLVHRDFKPDNVLVGADGRVRVTDFGLARAADDRTRPPPDMPASPRRSDRLTQTGAIVGTPAYMAPEQHRGEPANERSDQFAFCVTVWEALYGERPYAGDTYGEICANVLDGIRRSPPSSEVPPRVHAALVRGLSTNAKDRFPEMDDLLHELDVPVRSTRKLVAYAAIPVVLAVVGFAAWKLTSKSAAGPVCPTADAKLAGVWDGKRREQTKQALGAVAFGADIATRTTAALDAYTAKWSTSWNEACAATARGEQSPTMFDLRVACLGRRLRAVDTVAVALAKRDPTIAARAGELIDSLSPIDACNNTDSLARSAPPPALLPKIQAIDEVLDKSHEVRMGGNLAAARKLADGALADAEKLEYRPSISRALLMIAHIEVDTGDYAAAEKTLQRASTAAMSSNYDELSADILIELADVVGYQLARPAEAHRLVEIARGAIERIGNPPLHRLELLNTQSRIWLLESKFEPALAALAEAEKLTKELGDESRMIPILSAKGLILLEQGKFDEAFDLNAQEIALRAKAEGPRHPNYAFAIESRATLHFTRNAFEEGLRDLAAAREIKTAALGPDSPELLGIENNTGVIAGLLGDWNEALRSAKVTLAISTKHNGKEHPTTALAINNVGSALQQLGQFAEAEAALNEALALRKKLFGDKHPDIAVTLTELADLRLAQGRAKEAIPLYEEATKMLVEVIGEESPLIFYATSGLGQAQLAIGDLKAARTTLADVLKALDEIELDPVLNAQTRLALAETLWKLGDRAGARKIDIAAPLAKLPKGANAVLRETIATWVAKH